MIFRHFWLDTEEVNAYFVGCEDSKDAMLVDAGEFTDEMAAFLTRAGLRLTSVFITHDHYDHSGALGDVVRRYHPEVFAGKASLGGVSAHKVLPGDSIALGNLIGAVLATPGHTPEGVSLALPGHVFTGDALFAGSVGGTASPELARQQIDHIRKNIFTLPPDTEIHPGHGPASTVFIESRYNPFFD